jgi:hypothetical protein
MQTQERLEIAEKKILDSSFRQNKGLGNEVGYFVFDYPAKDELVVREWVRYWRKKNNPAVDGYEFAVFDLYDIMIDILEQEGYMEQCFGFEKKRGIGKIADSVERLLQLTEDSGGLIVDYIVSHTPENAVVFLVGVGKCHPVLQSHKILNNLYQKFDAVLVILFYPGKYDGTEFVLFGSIESNVNYYYATRLV